MIPNVLKNFALSVDGFGYAGKAKTFTPPKLTVKEEEFRGGGMDAPVGLDMGTEKLTAAWEMPSAEAELLKRFGLPDIAGVPLTGRGAFEDSTGAVTRVTINATGRIQEVDMGDWEAGAGAGSGTKYTMTLTYYKLTVDDDVIIEIDVINMKRVINGVDVLEAQRNAIGI